MPAERPLYAKMFAGASPALPAAVAKQLVGGEAASLLFPSDRGTVMISKLPAHEFEGLRGSLLIRLSQEIHQHPAAPVIRMSMRLYGRAEQPVCIETFINVADPEQRLDFESLTSQGQLYLLLYDEQLRHRSTKRLGGLDRESIRETLRRADALRASIPEEQFDFDLAKTDVMLARLCRAR